MKTFFGFALADSMLPNGLIRKEQMSVDQVKEAVEQGVESCCNASHTATVDAMRDKFGIDVHIPETPPRVSLENGDSVIVMGVRGLPRLTDRHHYTEEEIASATFTFSKYTVVE
jgi:hypothetical protein